MVRVGTKQRGALLPPTPLRCVVMICLLFSVGIPPLGRLHPGKHPSRWQEREQSRGKHSDRSDGVLLVCDSAQYSRAYISIRQVRK